MNSMFKLTSTLKFYKTITLLLIKFKLFLLTINEKRDKTHILHPSLESICKILKPNKKRP